MSGNIKFRWFLLAPIVIALLVVASPPVSSAGQSVIYSRIKTILAIAVRYLGTQN